MKNIATNKLGYTGVVTLSQYIGTKKVKIASMHNSGGKPLFELITNCLVGDFTTALSSMPDRVQLLEYDENNKKYISRSEPYYKLTAPEKVNDGYAVRYSFMIPKDVIKNINNIDKLSLGLYTSNVGKDDIENFAAICKLELSRSSILGAAVLVDWVLLFSNASTYNEAAN